MAKHVRTSAPLLIRDAVHGDITFGLFEGQIIRSRWFQRLHRVRQLGSTYHVYPSAMHTRFEHSLGTYFVAKKILQTIEATSGIRVTKDQQELVSVATLLHDITHLPFGHTLEDDFGLFSRHDTKERYEPILMDKEMRSILGGHARVVLNILTKHGDDLPSPCFAEIVGNTISADLLDYLLRDARFTFGTQRSYDDRILQYFRLDNHRGKRHFIINLFDIEKIRALDVITSLEELLRLRYILAERVYYYHTKIAADAMIGKAIAESGLSVEEIQTMGDDEVCYSIVNAKGGSPISNLLALEFRNRKLYRTAYMIDRPTVEEEGGYKNVTDFAKTYYKNRDKCKELEIKIAERAKVNYEDIVVFCHDPDMNLKAANAWVRDENSRITRLRAVSPEFERLNEKHKAIWRFYVFAREGTEKKVEKVTQNLFPNLKNKWRLDIRIRARSM